MYRIIPLLLSFVGIQLACPSVTIGGEFVFQQQTLTVPDGFAVERVADWSLVERPIVADFDEEGHLYVAESSGTNDPVQKQLEDKPHRVLRLTDTDGDGIFDTRTIFADKLMFPEGVLYHQGSVFVSAPPQIWKLTDTDKDGVADEREVWFDGQTLTHCANDLHGPYAGRDGWIYWCKGAFAEQVYERPGDDPLVTRAAHIFRRRAEGGIIEPVMTGGMDNPVDVVFSKTGERFITTTFLQHPSGGNRDGITHAIYGGVYGKDHGVLDDHPRTGDLMPTMDHLGPAAPCGLEYYEGSSFGPEFDGNLFAAHFNLHQVTRHRLKPKGATFESEASVFLKSDSLDFHPTDVFQDADGSLIIIDTGGWYKLCCPTSQLHKPDILGGIYRIRREGLAPMVDPRGGAIDWAGISVKGLVDLLADERPYVVERTLAQLSERKEEAIPHLSTALSSQSASAAFKQQAIWALTRIDAAMARSAVREALKDPDTGVVQAALHSLSVWRDATAIGDVEACLESPSLAVRRVAAEALGRIGDAGTINALLEAAGAPEVRSDRILEHSLTYALIEIGNGNATLNGLSSKNEGTLRAALWALYAIHEPLPSGKAIQTVALLQHPSLVIRQAAWQLLRLYPDYSERVIASVKEILGKYAPDSPVLRECQVELARFQTAPGVNGFISECLHSDNLREFAVPIIRNPGIHNPDHSWIAFIDKMLGSGNPEAVSDAMETVRIWTAGGSKETVTPGRFKNALESVLVSTSMGKSLRIAALELLSGVDGFTLEPFAFSLVLDSLSPSSDPFLRNQSSSILTRVGLNREQRIELARSLASVGPMELMKILPLFEGESDSAVGELLVSSLSVSPSAKTVDPGTFQTAFSGFNGEIREKAEDRIISRLAQSSGKELETLLAALPDEGDIRLGQRVFQSSKAACTACHRIGYLGGDLGPDLNRVGAIRSRRDLLEAIVFPSTSFVRSYEPVFVTKNDGIVVSGIIKDDGAESMTLAVGPGVLLPISQADISAVEPSPVSLMPPGMHTVLTLGELSGLIAFLESRK